MNRCLLFFIAGYTWISVFASPIFQNATYGPVSTNNDFSCQSDRNPVVFLHGLTGRDTQLKTLYSWLQDKGFCTFSLSYGALPLLPEFLGYGFKSMADSSEEIAQFIRSVKDRTGANKIDLVGHSEGAMQVLYVAKVRGLSPILEHLVAIAPPTHGVSLYGLSHIVPDFVFKLGMGVLTSLGCGACADMLRGGPATRLLDDGSPIAQPGNKVTIISSRFDQGVTPPASASFVDEPGVNNLYIQDYCPLDPVGHFHEPDDRNVFYLVQNALEDQTGRKFPCTLGVPLR